MLIFEWRPGTLIEDKIIDEQEDELSVHIKERNILHKDEVVDGNKEYEEKGDDEDQHIVEYDEIPSISDDSGESEGLNYEQEHNSDSEDVMANNDGKVQEHIMKDNVYYYNGEHASESSLEE